MRDYILFSGILLFIFAYYFFLRSRRHRGILTRPIILSELTEVYRDISGQAVETSFAVFIIPRQNQASIEVQFSVEEGITGLDWILESESNKAERHIIEQFCASQGFDFREKEMNNWHYLRIEEGDIVSLCAGIIRDLYGVEEFMLKYGGFNFRPFPQIIMKWLSIR